MQAHRLAVCWTYICATVGDDKGTGATEMGYDEKTSAERMSLEKA